MFRGGNARFDSPPTCQRKCRAPACRKSPFDRPGFCRYKSMTTKWEAVCRRVHGWVCAAGSASMDWHLHTYDRTARYPRVFKALRVDEFQCRVAVAGYAEIVGKPLACATRRASWRRARHPIESQASADGDGTV